MANLYVRQNVGGYIIKALQSLGGSASKKAIKEEIVADDSNDISYENAFEPILSKNGTSYIPFNLDFNFGLINLHTCGYIEDYGRRGDVSLTEAGRMMDCMQYPTEEDQENTRKYWEKKNQERAERKRTKTAAQDGKAVIPDTPVDIHTDDAADSRILSKEIRELFEAASVPYGHKVRSGKGCEDVRRPWN